VGQGSPTATNMMWNNYFKGVWNNGTSTATIFLVLEVILQCFVLSTSGKVSLINESPTVFVNFR